MHSRGQVVAGGLGAQQAPVGFEADPLQDVKVFRPSADVEDVGVVDHRLGTRRAPLLVVLLDPGMPVVDVQRRDDPIGDDAGSEPRWCASTPDTGRSGPSPPAPA